jgi:hypothetical protein
VERTIDSDNASAWAWKNNSVSAIPHHWSLRLVIETHLCFSAHWTVLLGEVFGMGFGLFVRCFSVGKG